MKTAILTTIPVLPTADLERDMVWYKEKMGFETYFADQMYAVLYRENCCVHLQWHADTQDDPLLGGSVVRIHVDNIQPMLEEFIERGTITAEQFKKNTPWDTNEFGFYDLNKNAFL